MPALNGDNGLTVKTSLGEVAAKGSQVVSAVLLAILTGVALWEHKARSDEHVRISEGQKNISDAVIRALEENECLNKLTIYQALQPNKEINWANMPNELYACMPKFMFEKR